MSAAKKVLARIRWRSERDASWEIETHHTGFAVAEDAALYANGFVTRSPAALVLKKGSLHLFYTDGTDAPLAAGTYQVWRLPEDFDASLPADDSNFVPVDITPRALSARGLDGKWEQLAYGILGPDGQPIDVLLQVDETGDLQVITIDEQAARPEEGTASFKLGVLPRA
jgi:hypothetical protein